MSDRPKVGLIVIGAQKAGTTSVWNLLVDNHPNISTASGRFDYGTVGNPVIHAKKKGGAKEMHFFDSAHAPKAAENKDWSIYEDLYPDDDRVGLDATPVYSVWPGTRDLIHAYNPDAQLVLMARDPIDRAFANYRMAKRKVEVPESFLQFALGSIARAGGRGLFLKRGAYALQIKEWSKKFRLGESFHLISFDSLKDNTLVANLNDGPLAALGLPPMEGVEEVPRKNVAATREEPDEEAVRILRMAYETDTIKLEKLTGMDFSHWKSHPDYKG